MFDYEDLSSFAMKDLREKLEEVLNKQAWTYDDLAYQLKNLNFYLTTLDSMHLTQLGATDIENLLTCGKLPKFNL